MSQDPIEAGRLEIALLSTGEWIVTFDGVEQARTIHPEQVRRECARLFLAHSTRRNPKGVPLKNYRVRNAPNRLVWRLSTAIDAHMAQLTRQSEYRDVVRQIVRQPSSLQRHWKVDAS